MDLFSQIDGKIKEGYECLAARETIKACDAWLEAWEGLKTMMERDGASHVADLNKAYEWADFPSNYVQELCFELWNAGLDDQRYHRVGIKYAQELIERVEPGDLVAENARRCMADAHAKLGEYGECHRLYGEWLKGDPEWGWGYLGWAKLCEDAPEPHRDLAMAEKLLRQALSVPTVRDRLAVVDKALTYYEGHGGSADMDSLWEEFSRLKAASPTSYTAHKAPPAKNTSPGRNDPCPCGSGRKYKKCHGSGGAN
jgi:tetratricopeptide (TPR) repeat protein